MLVDKSIEICTSKKKDLNLIQSKKKLSIVGITFSMILIVICVDIEKVDITVVVDTQKVDGNRNVEIKIMSSNIIKNFRSFKSHFIVYIINKKIRYTNGKLR